MIRFMTDSAAKHVFISYVHEDSDAVDGLCAVLDAAQIPYWRDRAALGPGDAWKAMIRQAIREGSLVFLCCFSDNSRAKEKSYMNEELTLAVEEFRQMRPGRTWLIPVRFDSGEVPDWDLGAGRALSDLNYLDLFGANHMANVARLVTTIHRLTGEKRPDAATALAAVEQATAANRSDLLKRLTKEMLLDPSRRIELDDLVSQEVQRVMAVLNDSERVAGPMTGSNDQKIVRLAEEAQELARLVEPFCSSLQVAARWGSPDLMVPWANGLRAFVSATTRIEGGVESLLALRHVPGVVGITTAAVACTAGRTWGNLKALVIDPTVRDRNEQKPLSLLEATSPHKSFDSSGWTANALARATLQGKDLTDALEDFTLRHDGKYHTPEAEWLHSILRPVFLDQLPDADTYAAEFDRAEVMVGLLATDGTNLRRAANPDGWINRSYWFGRATWRSQHSHGNPLEDYEHELAAQGALWGPLQGNLFGADQDRAKAAIEGYSEDFNRIARNRF